MLLSPHINSDAVQVLSYHHTLSDIQLQNRGTLLRCVLVSCSSRMQRQYGYVPKYSISFTDPIRRRGVRHGNQPDSEGHPHMFEELDFT
jgi:hypothetical protein